MGRPKKQPEEIKTRCEIPGCGAPAPQKYPKSPQRLNEYIWLCDEHAREHNKAWNYFDGMSAEEIEAFMKDAVTGHRPTWMMSDKVKVSKDQIFEALHNMFSSDFEKPKAARKKALMTKKEMKAFDVLELEYDFDKSKIKAHYKSLVKKYHPDVNKEKRAEEKFKKITQAFDYLKGKYKL